MTLFNHNIVCRLLEEFQMPALAKNGAKATWFWIPITWEHKSTFCISCLKVVILLQDSLKIKFQNCIPDFLYTSYSTEYIYRKVFHRGACFCVLMTRTWFFAVSCIIMINNCLDRRFLWHSNLRNYREITNITQRY